MSEAQLKALKVVELKDILTSANVALHGKANKADLVAKILASPDALQVYHARHTPQAQSKDTPQPAPPAEEKQAQNDDVDSQTTVATAPEAKPDSKSTQQSAPPVPASSTSQTESATPQPAADAPKSAEEIEAEKRKARAARFGIPLVEPSKPQTKTASPKSAPPLEDPEKLKARAARFGIKDAPPTANGKNKRAAPPSAEVDAEELERRRKRAERFGMAVSTTS
ncbi:hypothetical protein K474DRAFT_1655729 [Panus rudis PR-1116 ss-1]|nr:hypothetical protein K474DRAFT_1655729 [Panus rudis PR-1116 ss-1]